MSNNGNLPQQPMSETLEVRNLLEKRLRRMVIKPYPKRLMPVDWLPDMLRAAMAKYAHPEEVIFSTALEIHGLESIDRAYVFLSPESGSESVLLRVNIRWHEKSVDGELSMDTWGRTSDIVTDINEILGQMAEKIADFEAAAPGFVVAPPAFGSPVVKGFRRNGSPA